MYFSSILILPSTNANVIFPFTKFWSTRKNVTNPKYFFLCFSFVDKNEDTSDIVKKVDYGDKVYSDTLFSNKTETNFDSYQVSYSK